MKIGIKFSHLFLGIFSLITLSCFGSVSRASTHVIEFGGALGFSYSPNTLNVSIGDTIKWVGSFGNHPLQSVAVPGGAPAFGPISGGATFTYVVTVNGKYDYHCNFHGGSGMTGTFTAGTASVTNGTNNSSVSLDNNFPNPFSGSTKIKYTLSRPAHVSIKVFDVCGKEVKDLVNSLQNSGFYEVSLSVEGLTNGTYFFELRTSDAVLRKQMVISKQ